MHWYWIDRFTLFESQKRAESIKVVSLAEDYLHDHFRYHPVMPGSLMIEGLAQTGGLLVYEATGYKAKVVLAKISKVVFHQTEIVPGDVLQYHAILESYQDGGAIVSVSASRGQERMIEGDFMFAHLTSELFKTTTLFAEGDLIDMMQIFGVYDVGVDVDGKPLRRPKNP